MSLKAKRLLIRVSCHSVALTLLAVPILVSMVTEDESAAGFFAMLLLGYAVTLRVNPIPRIVERKVMREAQCPACGEVIDLVSTWSCGCGFLTWETRHAFLPCLNCKKVFTWLVCPRCEGSIAI